MSSPSAASWTWSPAFVLIRGYARSTNQLLSDVALSIVNGTTTADALLRPVHGSTTP